MFGVNDAEGVHENCSSRNDHVNASTRCPLRGGEYLGNLIMIREALRGVYAAADQAPPLMLVSSPTFSPASTRWPRVLSRLEYYEDAVYDFVRMHPDVCFGVNGRELLDPSVHFRREKNKVDWHPTNQGHRVIGLALAACMQELRLERWATLEAGRDWEAWLDSQASPPLDGAAAWRVRCDGSPRSTASVGK